MNRLSQKSKRAFFLSCRDIGGIQQVGSPRYLLISIKDGVKTGKKQGFYLNFTGNIRSEGRKRIREEESMNEEYELFVSSSGSLKSLKVSLVLSGSLVTSSLDSPGEFFFNIIKVRCLEAHYLLTLLLKSQSLSLSSRYASRLL